MSSNDMETPEATANTAAQQTGANTNTSTSKTNNSNNTTTTRTPITSTSTTNKNERNKYENSYPFLNDTNKDFEGKTPDISGVLGL